VINAMLLLDIILPIFLLIVLGNLFVRVKLLPKETSQHLMQYLFWIAGPAIIILSISNDSLSNMFVWKFWLAYPLSLLIATGCSFLFFKNALHRSKQVAIIASFLATTKNSIMIGLPLLLAILGPHAALPVTITILVFNCIITPLLIFILEQDTPDGNSPITSIKPALIGMVKNPFVLAAVIGILLSATQTTLPQILQQILSYIVPSFVPCALIAVGMDLTFTTTRQERGTVISITIINLVLYPLLAIALSYLFNLSPFYTISFIVLSALPTAKTMYIYAKKYNCFEQGSAMVISLTTALSLITIPLYIYVCQLLWGNTFINVTNLNGLL
jgi:malonate transporter and related proteins